VGLVPEEEAPRAAWCARQSFPNRWGSRPFSQPSKWSASRSARWVHPGKLAVDTFLSCLIVVWNVLGVGAERSGLVAQHHAATLVSE